MNVYFISYGDERFKKSLNRIVKEAKRTGKFNKVKKYRPKDLPIFIKASPAFAFDRGGGYWLWKPYIIYRTLKEAKEGDIVVYADAGCSVFDSDEWEKYFNYLESYNAIFFYYKQGFNYWGDQFDSTISGWIKKDAGEYFDRLFKNENWRDYQKLLAGFIIMKKASNCNIIEEWLKIMLFKQELLIDPYGAEINDQEELFIDHRHDQALLTPLVYFYQSRLNLLLLPENSERRINGQALFAGRIRDKSLKKRAKLFIYGKLGKSSYNFVSKIYKFLQASF